MNVLIKESQPLTAFGIHQLIENEFQDANVNLAKNVEEVISLFYERDYDMFIIDTELSLAETESLIKTIQTRHTTARILVYGNKQSAVNEFLYIAMGASGFISKKSDLDHVVSAINLISNGQVYISQSALKNGQINSQGINVPKKRLSKREFEVFQLLVKGTSVNSISEQLDLKQTTISTVKRRIMNKMNVSNIAELVLLSTKMGYN